MYDLFKAYALYKMCICKKKNRRKGVGMETRDDLFYKPKDAWVGDLIPYYEDGLYYGFYLHDPRHREGEYAEETTWHLITTKDFVNLTYHGEAIERGGEDAPNKNAYTGSVLKTKDGSYQVYYTAFNEKVKHNGRSVQSVMRAVGKDLYHLKTDEDFLFVADDLLYEAFDWRDPFVFYHEEEQKYWMLLAAREKGGGSLRGGCIALCKSEDLEHWTYEKPFFAPHMYVTMECPEVFFMNGWWYLVFSTFNDRFVTHYRMARDLNGPWKIPQDDLFDARADYAIKTASDGRRRYAFGWIPSKRGNCDLGPWEWGGTMVFHEILQNPDNGVLAVRAPEKVEDYYDQAVKQPEPQAVWCEIQAADTGWEMDTPMYGAALIPVPTDSFYYEMEFTVEGCHEFGIALHVDEGLEKGYFLRMDPFSRQIAWDMWPRAIQGKYQWQIKGDAACQLETVRRLPEGNRFRVQILREKDICVTYINGEVALSMRMYDHKGGCAGLYLVQGKAQIKEFSIRVRNDENQSPSA